MNMFSGIITAVESGELRVENGRGIAARFTIPKKWKVREGESVSIDGICSTVENVADRSFSVFWMPETIRRTSLSQLSGSHFFNLEQPLTLQTFINGHVVSGHIDATATVAAVNKDGTDVTITFAIDNKWTKYIISKGSIAVNGVALTVVWKNDDSFSVSLIPYTLQHTNLGALEKGDKVNIEVDTIAKYVEQLLSH